MTEATVADLRRTLVDIHAQGSPTPILLVALAPPEGSSMSTTAVTRERHDVVSLFANGNYPRFAGQVEVDTHAPGAIGRLRQVLYDTVVTQVGSHASRAYPRVQPHSYHTVCRSVRGRGARLRQAGEAPIVTPAEARLLNPTVSHDIVEHALLFGHDLGMLTRIVVGSVEVIVADRQWLCMVVSCIIAPPFQTTGVLGPADLELLVPPDFCPPAFLPFLLQHVASLGLGVPLDDTRIVIPMLRPSGRPDTSAPCFKLALGMRRDYTRRFVMETVPLQFWPIFLTRLLVFLDDWAGGLGQRVVARFVGGPLGEALPLRLHDDPTTNTAFSLWSQGVQWAFSLTFGLSVHGIPEASGVEVHIVCSRQDADELALAAEILGGVGDLVDRLVMDRFPWLKSVNETGQDRFRCEVPCACTSAPHQVRAPTRYTHTHTHMHTSRCVISLSLSLHFFSSPSSLSL